MEYFCIMVKTGGEEAFKESAQKLAQENGLTAQFYFFKRTVKLSGKKRGQTEVKPLFPGYVFLATADVGDEMLHILKEAKNFYNFLPNNAQICPLKGNDKRYILSLLRFGETATFSKAYFDKNDRIVIVSGPLTGFAGNIIRVDRRKQRVTVRLDLFSSISTFDLCYDVVLPQ